MYDKNSYTAATPHLSDQGLHLRPGPAHSFTKDSRIQELFAANVDQMYETMQIDANNYWRGYWPQHPVQLHSWLARRCDRQR